MDIRDIQAFCQYLYVDNNSVVCVRDLMSTPSYSDKVFFQCSSPV